MLGDERASTELPLVQLARSEARHYRQHATVKGNHVWLRTRGMPATRRRIGERRLAAGD